MHIKSIAAQEAEKRYNTDIPEISIGLNAIKQIVFKDACEWLLEYLADSDGDIHKFLQDKGVMSLAETFSPVTIQEWLKEYTAIHTAKMLGDRWTYTVDGMPERLPEHQVGDPVYDNSSITVYVSDYSDDVYNAYWDFSNNCWRHTLDDEILNDVVAWITKPQSHNK